MRIKELELTPPSKEAIDFFKKFMQEYEKGLKAIKTLAEIKQLLEEENCHFDKIKDLVND
ncbi:hypothetical protein IJ425_04065 [bacterium]|nr:hypothetical protein [bacterium]